MLFRSMREFTWALASKGKVLKKRKAGLENRVLDAGRALEILRSSDPFSEKVLADEESRTLLQAAIKSVVRNTEDDLTNELMRLRLMAHQAGMDRGSNQGMGRGMGQGMTESGRQGRVKHLAAQRMVLKRFNWINSTVADFPLSDNERVALLGFIQSAIIHQAAILQEIGRAHV